MKDIPEQLILEFLLAFKKNFYAYDNILYNILYDIWCIHIKLSKRLYFTAIMQFLNLLLKLLGLYNALEHMSAHTKLPFSKNKCHVKQSQKWWWKPEEKADLF